MLGNVGKFLTFWGLAGKVMGKVSRGFKSVPGRAGPKFEKSLIFIEPALRFSDETDNHRRSPGFTREAMTQTGRLYLVKVGAGVVYHARRWHIHLATAFPLARYYRILYA
jgi:hypothetical protein